MKRNTAIKAINSLPKVFELEDLFEKLLFIEKVEQGLDQAKSGKTVSHELIVRALRKTFSSKDVS